MQSIPICIKCGAPTGMVGGHFIKGCNCERSAQSIPGGGNPFERIRNMPTDNNFGDNSLYDIIKQIVSMECTDDKGDLNSFGKYPFAQAIKIIAKKGEATIISEKGPIIKAQWK